MSCVCPIYPYAFHGTYTSYYALHHPYCSNPISFDGPNGMQGNCQTGVGCVQPGFAAGKGREEYAIDPELQKLGMLTYPDFECGMLLANGADDPDPVLNAKVKLVAFLLPDQTKVFARVMCIRVKPSKFKDVPSQAYRKFKGKSPLLVWIGYEIDPAQVGNKKPVQGTLVTKMGALAVVEVRHGNKTLTYCIVLHHSNARGRKAAVNKKPKRTKAK